MSRLIEKEEAVPRPTKVLLGFALLLFAPFAVAQNTLGELLDAGAKKISPDEFKRDLVLRTVVGASAVGTRMELIYTSSGMIQGRSDPGTTGGTGATALTGGTLSAIDGVWNIDESGKICTSMVIGRVFLPIRCEYWFKYKDDYFLAVSDSDPKAKVLRRTVKQ